MPSFTRTIPAYKTVEEVEQVLSRRDHYVPLTFKPARAQAGDFIYLIFRGKIAGRARISAIDSAEADASPGVEQYPDWARWVIRYTGGWEKPPREIAARGHQGVRYLEEQSLAYLDSENW